MRTLASDQSTATTGKSVSTWRQFVPLSVLILILLAMTAWVAFLFLAAAIVVSWVS